MPDHARPDAVASAIAAAAHQVVADLLRSGASPRPAETTAAEGGWAVTVTVTVAAPADPRGLTECERDLLAVLATAGERLPTGRVLEELARRGLVHSEVTVKRSLARLVKLCLLGSSHVSPRGYWLLSHNPLVGKPFGHESPT